MDKLSSLLETWNVNNILTVIFRSKEQLSEHYDPINDKS